MSIVTQPSSGLRLYTNPLHRNPFGKLVDGRPITDTIKRALAAAGLKTQTGVMKGVTDTIQQALSAAGLMQRDGGPSQGAMTLCIRTGKQC